MRFLSRICYWLMKVELGVVSVLDARPSKVVTLARRGIERACWRGGLAVRLDRPALRG